MLRVRRTTAAAAAIVAVTTACSAGARQDTSGAAATNPSYSITATDYVFALPADMAVKGGPGRTLVLALDNRGTTKHELELFDPAGKVLGEIEPVEPGSKAAVTFEVERPGSYQLVCGVDDHEARGMVATLPVA